MAHASLAPILRLEAARHHRLWVAPRYTLVKYQVLAVFIELVQARKECIRSEITGFLVPMIFLFKAKMGSHLERLEKILANVLTEVWMVEPSGSSTISPKIIDTIFHLRRADNEQGVALHHLPVRIVCVRIMKMHLFIHVGLMLGDAVIG
jgi:hypothetical protein